MQKLKAGLMKPFRPTTPIPPGKPVTEQSEGHPEWLIHEDWALLQVFRIPRVKLTVLFPRNGYPLILYFCSLVYLKMLLTCDSLVMCI